MKEKVRDNLARMRVAGYLSIFGIFFASFIVVLPLVVIYGTDIPVMAALLSTFVIELGIVVVALFYSGEWRRFKDILGLKNFRISYIVGGISVGVIYFLGLAIIQGIFSHFGVEVGNSDTSDMFNNLTGSQRVIILLVFVSIVGPIIEELFFRGYILGFLREGHKALEKKITSPIVLWTIIFSSIIFAILHFQGLSRPIDFLVLGWTFLFASASAILRIKTDSLYPSMAAHITYNGAGALIMLLSVS